MVLNVPSMEKLVHELSKLPGIGAKTAQRLGYFILKAPEDYVDSLRLALLTLKTQVHECPRCFSYTEDEVCALCLDSRRSDELLCIVEDPSDIERIEGSGAFKGRYHVLQGAISPLDGVAPSDLRIAPLIDRIKKGQQGLLAEVQEVIFALDSDLEGDTTVLYVARILREMGVRTSRLAQGVPIGGDIDFIDYRTLGRALENRVQL